MSLLADLYAGAALKSKTAKAMGTQAAIGSGGSYVAAMQRRKKLLEDGVQRGEISSASLGPSDKQLLSSAVAVNHFGQALDGLGLGVGGKPAKGIGGFISNLGSDIANTGKYIVPGLFEAGKSIVSDVSKHPESLLGGPTAPLIAGLEEGKNSESWKNIVKPTINSYAYTYGGKGDTEHKGLLQRLYEHPLQPILDAATVASVGAGAAAKAGGLAGRLAPESTLGRVGANVDRALTAREGRAPLDMGSFQLERDYTPRPLAKAGQRIIDNLAEHVKPIGDLQKRTEGNRFVRMHNADKDLEVAHSTSDALASLKEVSKLSNAEAWAFHLSHMGLNTDEALDAFQDRVRAGTLSDPKKMEEFANIGVDPAFIHASAHIPTEVRNLVKAPTELMRAADNEWRDFRVKTEQDYGLSPEEVRAHLAKNQRNLGLEDYVDNPDALAPAYAPSQLAQDFHPVGQGFLGKLTPTSLQNRLAALQDSETPLFRRGPSDKPTQFRGVDEAVMAERTPGFMRSSTGETSLSGAARHDARLYLEQGMKERRFLIDRQYNLDFFGKVAAKNPDGDLIRFKNQDEVDRHFGVGQMTLMNDKMPIRWLHGEINYMEKIQNIIDGMKKGDDNFELDDTNLEEILKSFTEKDAQAFIKTNWQAMKSPGVAVPKHVADQQMAFFELDQPYKYAAQRFFARWMHRWRTMVLTYMPRWAMNTALGSMVMAVARGVLNPLDYYKGHQLARDDLLPKGVGLAHQAEKEVLDTAMPAYGKPQTGMGHEARTFASQLGIRFPTQKLMHGVQSIEDFFRRGAFVKALREEQARNIRHTGGRDVALDYDSPVGPDIIDPHEPIVYQNSEGELETITRDQAQELISNPESGLDPDTRASLEYDIGKRSTPGEKADALGSIGDTLNDFYSSMFGRHEGNVESALQDPKTIARSLNEVNKFFYNYSILGPAERRLIRQFVPFWGWYKFISQTAYRLPVEYPGKANMLAMVSRVAQEDEAKLGPMPEWVRGGLILGVHGGKETYIPTLGMNPFGSFFNPIGKKGPLAGTLDPGQLNPAIQAVMQGLGYDTLTGSSVRVSPQEGVTQDFQGTLTDVNGDAVNPMEVAPVRRTAMALMRSFPEFRLGEKYLLNQGRGNYPESVPILAPRLLGPPKSGAQTQNPFGDLALSQVGMLPRTYDLKNYQSQRNKKAKYARRKIKHDIKKSEK